MPRSKPTRTTRIHNKAPSSGPIEDIELDEPSAISASQTEINDAVRTLEYQQAVTARSKREAILSQKIREREANTQPYSRSHAKRLRAKEKSSLTANLDGLLDQVSIPEVVQEEMTISQLAEGRHVPSVGESKKESKKEKLTAKKRQKVLEEAQTRLPQLLNHKEFVANPFAAIRQHAANTLVAHRTERRPVGKK